MGTGEEYYRILGRAVDDGNFARELNDAGNLEGLKDVVRMRTQIELDDEDLRAVQEAVKHLTGLPRPGGPGGKYRT